MLLDGYVESGYTLELLCRMRDEVMMATKQACDAIVSSAKSATPAHFPLLRFQHNAVRLQNSAGAAGAARGQAFVRQMLEHGLLRMLASCVWELSPNGSSCDSGSPAQQLAALLPSPTDNMAKACGLLLDSEESSCLLSSVRSEAGHTLLNQLLHMYRGRCRGALAGMWGENPVLHVQKQLEGFAMAITGAIGNQLILANGEVHAAFASLVKLPNKTSAAWPVAWIRAAQRTSHDAFRQYQHYFRECMPALSCSWRRGRCTQGWWCASAAGRCTTARTTRLSTRRLGRTCASWRMQ
jgi:hypothetical protein